ncbi:TetR/AcrR family transcriptional regulator [Mycobacterium sp.]|uniref:TetR/AcrR family transcriptional regulator n=1 Tax=Mycobacterium sp. TaxID=1785 RepID=UPI003A8A9655
MPAATRKPQDHRGNADQHRQQQMERRLVEATEHLMNDGTRFTELSVDRLATEAGISRASFYLYFEDKGHLLRRLADEAFADLAAGGKRWWDVAWRHDRADVHAAVSGIIAGYRRHQAVLIALDEASGYDPATAQAYRDLLGAIIDRVTSVIQEGQEDGSIRRELPPATTASALTWMVERTCQQNLPARPPEFDPELASTLVEVIWGALYLKPVR